MDEQKQEFKIGDVVMLKSGSPHMTIYGFDKDGEPMLCFWHYGESKAVAHYGAAATLKLVE